MRATKLCYGQGKRGMVHNKVNKDHVFRKLKNQGNNSGIPKVIIVPNFQEERKRERERRDKKKMR